jgi:hypothetical protein
MFVEPIEPIRDELLLQPPTQLLCFAIVDPVLVNAMQWCHPPVA